MKRVCLGALFMNEHLQDNKNYDMKMIQNHPNTIKIRLKDREIISEGCHRSCYLHPNDQNKILKVLMNGRCPKNRRKKSRIHKKFRPLSSFDDNLKNIKACEYLNKKGTHVWRHFPKCYGLVKTDLGNAMCMELIKGKDGSIAPTVHDYILKNGLTYYIRDAIEEFCLFLKDNLIITRDLQPKNLIVDNKNEYRIYMIDGVGNSDFIPIANFSKPWAKNKIKRHIDRLMKNILALDLSRAV